MQRNYFEDVLRLVASWLVPFIVPLIPPPPPFRPEFLITGQEFSPMMIITVPAPRPTSTDYGKAVLEYQIDGGTSVQVETNTDPVVFKAPVDSTVIGFWTVYDLKGNKSEPGPSATFGVTDTIAPPAPEAPSFGVTGQEEDVPVPVEPTT